MKMLSALLPLWSLLAALLIATAPEPVLAPPSPLPAPSERLPPYDPAKHAPPDLAGPGAALALGSSHVISGL
jgi:hypothetical protein